MTLTSVKLGDIVEVDKKGRRFYAFVNDRTDTGLAIKPIDRRITYRECTAREVIDHWRHSRAGDRLKARISAKQLEAASHAS